MSNADVVARYFEVLNAEAWDEFGDLFTSEAQFRGVGARPRTGSQDIADFFRSAFTSWRTHRDEPAQYFEASDGALAVSVKFVGVTHEGDPVSFAGVDVFHFRDGRIAELENYYDLHLVRRLLGRAS